MEFTSRGPSLDFRDDDEAEAFGYQIATAIKLAYDVRDAAVPSLLRAARDYLVPDASGAMRGNVNPQVIAPRGPSKVAPGHDVPRSDQVGVTVNEAARLARVHPRTVRKWLEAHRVDSVRSPRGVQLVDWGSLAAEITRRQKETDDRKAA